MDRRKSPIQLGCGPLSDTRAEAFCRQIVGGEDLRVVSLSCGYKSVEAGQRMLTRPDIKLRIQQLEDREVVLADQTPMDVAELQQVLSALVRDPDRDDNMRIRAATALHGMLDPHASARETPVQDLIGLVEAETREHGATPETYDDWLAEESEPKRKRKPVKSKR